MTAARQCVRHAVGLALPAETCSSDLLALLCCAVLRCWSCFACRDLQFRSACPAVLSCAALCCAVLRCAALCCAVLRCWYCLACRKLPNHSKALGNCAEYSNLLVLSCQAAVLRCAAALCSATLCAVLCHALSCQCTSVNAFLLTA